jgi:hypothetical protein
MALLVHPAVAGSQPAARPANPGEMSPTAAPWLDDRGPGIWTSIFGTYVRSRELLVSPFAEYYFDDNFEYKPAELGYGLDQDFRGRFRATEGLVFLAYGVNDRLALELEASVISARLDKAADDPSSQPARIRESGQGDWQVELDWRVFAETASRPEVFALLEIDPPSNRHAALIGTPDWEVKLGAGMIRGLGWGTVAARAGLIYSAEGGTVEASEYAVEYLKRLSPRWRVYGGIEGEQDEVELIGEAQWHFSPRAYLRLNLSRGLSSKATDWAPDVGVVFALPGRGNARTSE